MRSSAAALLAVASAAGLLIGACEAQTGGARRTVLFVCRRSDHGYGEHEYAAAGRRIARHLEEALRSVRVAVCEDGWPGDRSLVEHVSAVVVGSDAGRLVKEHGEELERLAAKGAGLAFLHYTLDPGTAESCERMMRLVGGVYEQHWSVNPYWEARFDTLPDHPITRGVRPFSLEDEWYYHLRFVPDMKGVTPILEPIPPEFTRMYPFGPHTGNPAVRARKGMREVVAWAYERPDGGRGFGLTGLHTYWTLADDSLRTLLLNAVVWVAGAEVPAGGVPSRRPTLEELMADIGRPAPEDFDAEAARIRIERMNRP